MLLHSEVDHDMKLCHHSSSVNVFEWFVCLRSVEYLFGNMVKIMCPLVVLFSAQGVLLCIV